VVFTISFIIPHIFKIQYTLIGNDTLIYIFSGHFAQIVTRHYLLSTCIMTGHYLVQCPLRKNWKHFADLRTVINNIPVDFETNLCKVCILLELSCK